MIKSVMNAPSFGTTADRARVVELMIGRRGALRLDHAFVDDRIARLERQQQMIAANAAVEAGHAVVCHGHAVAERRVARGDFIDRARADDVRLLVRILSFVDIAVHHAFSLKRTWSKYSKTHSGRHNALALKFTTPCVAVSCDGHFTCRLRSGFFSFFLLAAYFVLSMIFLRRAM